jgi:hypothetical protein
MGILLVFASLAQAKQGAKKVRSVVFIVNVKKTDGSAFQKKKSQE